MRCTTQPGDSDPAYGHDWAKVKVVGTVAQGDFEVLWACPCSEFRWTSYAEWEGRESLKDPHRDASPTQADEPPTPRWSVVTEHEARLP